MSSTSKGLLEVPKRIVKEASRAIVGKEDVMEGLLMALLAEGHVLLLGVPGVAKTTIAKAFARVLGCHYSRVQCTPDLLPADITGSFVLDQKTGDFKLVRGPIFANIVLADEINRNTPKTQSAVLEAMQEGQVTIEGSTLPLDRPFMVMATQNPIEVQGVFPLPEAQLDRFLMRISVEYPSLEEELDILSRSEEIDPSRLDVVGNPPIVLELVEAAKSIFVAPEVKRYIAEIVRMTRSDERLSLGASPRGGIALYRAAKARALLRGREYVIPDDIKDLTQKVLPHRLILTLEAEAEEVSPPDIVDELLAKVPIPKSYMP